MKYELGQKVLLKKDIPLYKSSNAFSPNGLNDKDRVTYITRRAEGTKHPYNTTGDLGWINEKDIIPYNEEKKYEGELTLIDKNGLVDYLKEHDDKILVLSSKQLKDILGW